MRGVVRLWELTLAVIESTLPAGLEGWTVDFFLPQATTAVQEGFNGVTFVGVGGTDVVNFVARFGGTLEALWRFNAAATPTSAVGDLRANPTARRS